VLIKAHSQVVLKAPNEGKGYFLEQLIGKILVKVQKRLGVAPSFRMGTPSAVITVRGTRFEVEVNKKGKTFVDVFEGVVDVGGITEGSPHVLIRPGFYTGVEQDRSPDQPREMNQEGPGHDSGHEGQGPGAQRSPEDQQRSQPKQPSQGGEKPD
jgi:ferric-dicitrate binding protein FerR (iron transport regulator)